MPPSAPAAPPFRVAGITVAEATFHTMSPSGHHAALIWGAIDRCVVPAEQRTHARWGDNENNIPAALMVFKVTFPYIRPANTSILGPLTTDYPALARSLRVLNVEYNDYDESATLGAFAALATGLQELIFVGCGIASVRGLEGQCENLRRVDLWGCKHLGSIDGLADRVSLEMIGASQTPIASIEPLRGCLNLTNVHLSGCQRLSSNEALEHHQRLREVQASLTAVTSIEALRSCPALTKVVLYGCERLPADISLPDSVEVIRDW